MLSRDAVSIIGLSLMAMLGCEDSQVRMAGKAVAFGFGEEPVLFMIGNDGQPDGNCVKGECEHRWTYPGSSKRMVGKCDVTNGLIRVEIANVQKEAGFRAVWLTMPEESFGGVGVELLAQLRVQIDDEVYVTRDGCFGSERGFLATGQFDVYEGHITVNCIGMTAETGAVSAADVSVAMTLQGCPWLQE